MSNTINPAMRGCQIQLQDAAKVVEPTMRAVRTVTTNDIADHSSGLQCCVAQTSHGYDPVKPFDFVKGGGAGKESITAGQTPAPNGTVSSKLIKFGDCSDDVRKIQQLLNKLLVPPPDLAEDGIFGPETLRAVNAFQAANNLDVDGLVGPQTLRALGLQTMPSAAFHDSASGQPRIPPAQGTQRAAEVQDRPAPGQHDGTGAPWMRFAKSQLGVKEDSRTGQSNPEVEKFHKTTGLKSDDDPWCSSFVNWAVEQSGRKGTDSAAAMSWLNWGKSVPPTEGAVTVIRKKNADPDDYKAYHVGFLESKSDSGVQLLGGNQSDQVKHSNYSSKDWVVVGYRM